MTKRILSVICALTILFTLSVSAFAAPAKDVKDAAISEKGEKTPDRGNYAEAVAAAKAAAVEASGLDRSQIKYVSADVIYVRGEAQSIRVEIGVYDAETGEHAALHYDYSL